MAVRMNMFSKKTLVATLMIVAIALVAAGCGAAIAEAPGAPPTTADPTSEDRASASFIGLTIEAAGLRAQEQGRPWRVISQDGIDLVVTDDYSEDRLNFTIVAGNVTDAKTDAELAEDEGSGIAPGEQNRESISFVGLSTDEAAMRAEEQGRPWRIISEDGVDLAVTYDYSEDRLNFTVVDGQVVDAKTDAEMASGVGSCTDVTSIEGEGEVIGAVDINDDGKNEVFAVIDAGGELSEIAIWSFDSDCSLRRVTLDGEPAVLLIGLSETAAGGVSCEPEYVDDLYIVDLASSDGGDLYEGRIAGYNLAGAELTEASGEGAGYEGAGAAAIAVLACGGVVYP